MIPLITGEDSMTFTEMLLDKIVSRRGVLVVIAMPIVENVREMV